MCNLLRTDPGDIVTTPRLGRREIITEGILKDRPLKVIFSSENRRIVSYGVKENSSLQKLDLNVLAYTMTYQKRKETPIQRKFGKLKS